MADASADNSILSIPALRKHVGAMMGSLKNRIILLTGISVLLSTMLVGGFTYLQFESIIYQTALEKLPRETELLAQQFKGQYDEMRTDALLLADTPPVDGIIRSARTGGIDPEDGSSLRIWRKRLATIFTSLLNTRPHYTQIRYIGLADDGREIVRVNRTPSGIQTVAVSQLQQKDDEPYFGIGLETPSDNVRFSEVTYNREFGRVDQRYIPTLRAVSPVFDEYGAMFGLIVINADYELLLQSVLKSADPRHDTYVLNQAGDYLEHSRLIGLKPLELHTTYTRPRPAYISHVLDSTGDADYLSRNGDASYFARVRVEAPDRAAYIGVITHVPEDLLLASAYGILQAGLAICVGLISVCVLLSMFLARRFTAPLQRMARAIRMSGGNVDPEELPVDREDEIGELARAFVHNQSKLNELGSRARAVINNVVDGLLTIDEKGTIDSYNPACTRIFGYEREEAIGKNISMLMPQPHRSQHDRYLKHFRDTGERRIIGATRELEGQRKDGSVFPIELAVSEVQIKGRRLFSGIVRDISERRQMDIMKNEFISTVNHELRTPLTAIQGALSLLRLHADNKADEKRRRLLDISIHNCERLSSLVNDILDIEKIAAGKMEYRMEPVEIGALVQTILDAQATYAQKQNVHLIYTQPKRAIGVEVDRERFTQALVNLLSNAVKFSTAGDEVIVRVQRRQGNVVRVSVHDHGPGIPASFHDKIFGRFAQADSSATRSRDGSGLGLNITKSIIEAFDGSVGFTSAVGKGSTFFIDLPVRQPIRDVA